MQEDFINNPITQEHASCNRSEVKRFHGDVSLVTVHLTVTM